MALYPQSFIDEVRTAADIVLVVQDTVPLRRAGTTYKGLCPFHGEKTPSFTVNRERGFFHCFGCGVGGDVFKFVELRDKVGFGEAVRTLAQRFGLTVPAPEGRRDPTREAEREALLRAHEMAAAWFKQHLRAEAGARAAAMLAARDIAPDTVEALGLGYAPASRDALVRHLIKGGIARPLVVRSGLGLEREGGEVIDRFRNRLMIPICRESGIVVAFGGRAMADDQQPKYLNSPETPMYTKGRTLYGLNLSRQAIRERNTAVVVEGYFDFAQAWQGGVRHLVATCGTALTPAQAQTLRRFARNVVLSFDADSAGSGAAAKSSTLLVEEGFDVAVAVLPGGDDPDTFVRREGGDAYAKAVEEAIPYLDFLLERTAREHDLAKPAGRRAFVEQMLAVAAKIPEATARDQFADRLAHRARISEEVIRHEIRRAAVAKRTSLPGQAQLGRSLRPAERHLLAALLNAPADALPALAGLDDEDLEGLASARVLREARELPLSAADSLPGALFERLSEEEVRALTALAAGQEVPAAPAECARALRILRYQRERADVQRALDRLQEQPSADAVEVDALLQRKSELQVRIEALNA